MKKHLRGGLSVLLSCLILFSFSGCSTIGVLLKKAGEPGGESSASSASSGVQHAPPSETDALPANASASESVTLMMYFVGSDLESDLGSATDDILEILDAATGENVRIVLQTGGAMEWWNDTIQPDTCQRFLVENGDLTLEADLGLLNMAAPETLSDFIAWSAEAYPADRYGLILWNHGAGTMMGFGYDEYFPEDMLELSDLSAALSDGGVHFDFIGFDACLMATVEVAAALMPYADYLVASEESEPCTGWSYTDWLTALESDPAMPTETLGALIAESFFDSCTQRDEPTLSVVDLQRIPALCDALQAYLDHTEDRLEAGEYASLARARSDTKEYGELEFDQIDIFDFITQSSSAQSGLPESEAVLSALQDAVVCSYAHDAATNGLAMYFPYRYPEYYADVQDQMRRVGFDEDYFDFFDEFVNVLAYGQTQSSGTSHGSFLGGSVQDYSNYDWFDPNDDILEDNYQPLDSDELVLTDKGDYYALSLSAEAWDTITYIEMQVLLDDGEGFIDLGRDNVYDFDEDGDLIADFDYYWIALDGITVPFYAENETVSDDGYWYTYGCVPAELNDERDIEIILRWDSDHDSGYVAGYRYAEEGPGVADKGLRQLAAGDTVRYWCDYYTYDYDYDGAYYLGDPVVCTDTPFAVEYIEIDEYPTEVCFFLRDIYNNEYWTETVEFWFE